MSCFGKVYNPRQIYEIIGRYWASEDEFDYPMTRHDPYNDVIVHVMQQEWTLRVNQAEVLREDLRFLGSPTPKRHAITFPWNTNSNLRKTINMIREENNRMTIRYDSYYMLQNFRQIAEEIGKVLDSPIVNNTTSMREHHSDIEMSDEESLV